MITKEMLKKFLMAHQKLSGSYAYAGVGGVYEYIDAAGCIQYDPVDVVGRNADITLQARVKDYTKDMLDFLLYDQRSLVDGYDKMMSIYPAKYWNHMALQRKQYQSLETSIDASLIKEGLKQLQEHEVFTTDTLKFEGVINWGYGKTPISRALMDLYYYQGHIVIHHKVGTQRYFTHRHAYFGDESEMFETLCDLHAWYVYRRIGNIGVLWNKNSGALLGIPQFKQKERNAAFQKLLEENKIVPIRVEGIKEALYIRTHDLTILESIETVVIEPRMELLAPLDPLIWDRKLIRAIFDFDYTWEIYTPKDKRQYGHYVLPIVYDNDFIGRIALMLTNGVLSIDKLWIEKGKKLPKRILNQKLKQFAKFNNAKFTVY